MTEHNPRQTAKERALFPRMGRIKTRALAQKGEIAGLGNGSPRLVQCMGLDLVSRGEVRDLCRP